MALLKTHTHTENVPRQQSPEELLALLRSGATEAKRRDAALDLASVPDSTADLAACLATESAQRVREAIVTALVGIGSEAAADALAVHIAGEDVALRNDAVEALRQMGDAATATVERLLESPEADVRIFAVQVLDTVGHAHAKSLLHGVLAQEPEINVGLAAVEALRQVGGPEDIPALRAFANRFAGEPFAGFAVEAACRLVSIGVPE